MLNKTGKLQVFIYRQSHNIIDTMKTQWNKSETWNLDTHTFFYFNKDRRTKSERCSPAFGYVYLFSLQGKLRSCFLTAHGENEGGTRWMSWWKSEEN